MWDKPPLNQAVAEVFVCPAWPCQQRHQETGAKPQESSNSHGPWLSATGRDCRFWSWRLPSRVGAFEGGQWRVF